MTLKLKLKVGGSKSSGSPSSRELLAKPLPKIKIKTSAIKDEPSDGVWKPLHKEKHKKLRISLGKASLSEAGSAAPPSSGHTSQSILKKIPKVRIKPTRIPGDGYDSEAPDVEDDPLIEQGIAIRFANDANLDFVHNAVDTGDFSNVNIKWITREKAVVNVNLTLYSARLVDLPTITEIYKTVDKKNIFKTLDISQILLVLRTINPKNLNMDTDFEVPEEYTYTHPLYTLSVNNEIKSTRTVYRHGLSYSTEDVYRRFRPRKVNHRLMVDVDLRVDELVRRDAEAQESHYEYVDPRTQTHRFGNGSASHTPSSSRTTTPAPRFESGDSSSQFSRPQEQEEEDRMALDLEADLDNVLEQELAEALDSTSNKTAATVLMKSEYDNEDEEVDDADNGGQADEDDDEDEGDDDEEEEDDDDEDEDTKQGKSKVKKLEEEIADLERAADKQKALLASASYKMMRMKFQSAYNNLRAQLDQKKREMGKIREQQQKQQQMSEPQPKVDAEEEEEEDEEEEEEEEEAGEEEAEAGEHERTDENVAQLQSAMEEVAASGPGEEHDDENEDFDDFQGLF